MLKLVNIFKNATLHQLKGFGYEIDDIQLKLTKLCLFNWVDVHRVVLCLFEITLSFNKL